MSPFNWSEFDASTVETPSREALPPGEYVAMVTESSIKSNKAATGEYLALTFQVVEGEHEGRFVWDNLNLVHPNETAVQIARAALASLCKAVDVLNPKDSIDLHGKPVLIRVVVEKDRNGNPRNAIKTFKPAASRAPQSTPTPKAEGKASTPPWKKK
jgi:hypothetical protein